MKIQFCQDRNKVLKILILTRVKTEWPKSFFFFFFFFPITKCTIHPFQKCTMKKKDTMLESKWQKRLDTAINCVGSLGFCLMVVELELALEILVEGWLPLVYIG